MELRKTGIILLALLLAAMAMVPMVSANAVEATSYGQASGSYIVYHGTGTHTGNPGVSNWEVKTKIFNNPSLTNPLQSNTWTCSGPTNTCPSPNYYYYPSVHQTYYVVTTVTGDGHATAGNTVYVSW